MDLNATFEKYSDDFNKFYDVKNPLNARPDLCAFLMLDKLQPRPTSDMITAAEHDVIYLGTVCDELAKTITTEQVRDLARCGVMYDPEFDCLSMFV